ncbi:hypothetical protein HanPI659440_Chr11g0436411 [Helianthus annuus]|nr:hypothetical protein HanPI659440_Chr11g0436411 [Helianthus annuus]
MFTKHHERTCNNQKYKANNASLLKKIVFKRKEPVQSKTRSRSKGRSKCKYEFKYVYEETNIMLCVR